MPTRGEARADRAGWAEFAVQTRDCLAHLGFTIVGNCMPDETEPCGGTYREHARANLTALIAVADHQLKHAGGLVPETYDWATGLIRADCKRDTQNG
jgi:hypothetical protein